MITRSGYPSREEIDSLIMKYADEAFTLADAVRFEVLAQREPGLAEQADVNRELRKRLQSLPLVPAQPGFTERLMTRLET